MEKNFWLERWQQQQIGFHQSDINRYLQEYWHQARETYPQGKVFVPLCGKSRDMIWLEQQGHEVLGIEFSEMAVNDFFTENQLTPSSEHSATFSRHRVNNINLLCGDFFDLTGDDLDQCHLVFDRASLVALPEALRKRYTDQMIKILPADVSILLITMEYPQNEMDGPPFSVPETEVRSLFEEHFNVEKLDTYDIYAENPRFKQRGLSRLVEKVFLLSRAEKTV